MFDTIVIGGIKWQADDDRWQAKRQGKGAWAIGGARIVPTPQGYMVKASGGNYWGYDIVADTPHAAATAYAAATCRM